MLVNRLAVAVSATVLSLINGYGTLSLGNRDRVAATFTRNSGEFRLSTRLSNNQYLANPYQRGCARAATAAAGCGAIQPTSATPFRGSLKSHNVTSDVTHREADITIFVGILYNYLDNRSFSFNKTSAGRDGYGIPQVGSLFVSAAGVPGNNTALKSQRTTGIDIGAQITLAPKPKAEVTSYHEWLTNELVSQSAGVNLLACTANIPKSVHRGVELGLAWHPLPSARIAVSFSYNDHRCTDFTQRLTATATSAAVDRAGNATPGVVPTFVSTRIGYHRPGGALKGLGGVVEATHRGRYVIDNGNLLAMSAYTLVNLNLHHDRPRSRVSPFASLQNLFDRTYVTSASVIANSLNATTGAQNPAAVLAAATGSIYAGQPRTIVAGIRSRW